MPSARGQAPPAHTACARGPFWGWQQGRPGQTGGGRGGSLSRSPRKDVFCLSPCLDWGVIDFFPPDLVEEAYKECEPFFR